MSSDWAARRSKVTVCSQPAARPSSAITASAKSMPSRLPRSAARTIESWSTRSSRASRRPSTSTGEQLLSVFDPYRPAGADCGACYS